ncbi:GPW/gp25 family protein [uncultured Megasphaera sp.]|uniref:GPW/gp25 family protein n=1 Tax=uncultured Megasphaera sp. TaxID=165188 RepID=UPI00266BE5DD|nr:GPW/gp25 family protein [uncultured Megasphaera sp.]
MIILGKAPEIDWEPDSEVTEISQNIQTLISTHVFSVPLDRRLGVSWDAIDEPLDGSSEGILREEIFNAIQTYEPRVVINSIDFEYDTNEQRLKPIVDVSIKRK